MNVLRIHLVVLTILASVSGTAHAQLSRWDELAFQRAVQTYLWSLPAMNVYAMREGQKKAFGADSNVLAIWKDRID